MRMPILLTAVLLALIGGETAAQGPTPAYPEGGDRPSVLMDAGHFNMQTPEGSYRSFLSLVRNDGYEVAVNDAEFEAAVLADHDVLVVVSPQPFLDSLVRWSDPVITHRTWMRPALSEEEVNVVETWVREGGALLLISGHAPQAFWSAPLAGRFGVDVHNSYAADSLHSVRTYETWPRGAFVEYTRDNGLLGDHPITNGRSTSERVERIRVNGAASLDGPPGSVSILQLSDAAHEWIFHDFAFWDDARYVSVGAAGRSQGVALLHGAGRVVVLAPSALFFESYLSDPANHTHQLALNIMHWLSGLTGP